MVSVLLSVTFTCGVVIAVAHVLNRPFVAPVYDVAANLTSFSCAVAASVLLGHAVPATLSAVAILCWLVLARRTFLVRRGAGQAGTLAEFAVVPVTTVVAKPAGLDHVTSTTAPRPRHRGRPYARRRCRTKAVDSVDPQPGQVVLVNGASGGVGRFVLQLLAARGVTVVAIGTPAYADRL